ncbi:hypothetical protein AMTR_s00001p00272620 [Amborella trichopoda]|uniref:Uncharacterized protein n=1 Tax=Amborella trichopoda TaxID=13333 RepID=W1NMZ5_AMBTC|nr:hypothetical protein AMTR_s00001p00272620 [Amborella trichopoda]
MEKGTKAVLLGAKAAGSGVGFGTKGPRTSSSHAANSQILTLSLFFPRGQEAHQQHVLRDSTVFALYWVDS